MPNNKKTQHPFYCLSCEKKHSNEVIHLKGHDVRTERVEPTQGKRFNTSCSAKCLIKIHEMTINLELDASMLYCEHQHLAIKKQFYEYLRTPEPDKEQSKLYTEAIYFYKIVLELIAVARRMDFHHYKEVLGAVHDKLNDTSECVNEIATDANDYINAKKLISVCVEIQNAIFKHNFVSQNRLK